MSPTSRLLAVLMLAVTIAASTAASAVVGAAVLSSLGVPDNGRLLNIEPLRDLPGRGPVVFNESYPNYLRLRDRHFDAFSAMTCVIQSVIGWEDRGEMRPLQASRVTASFFATVGVPMAAGQPFSEADDAPTPAPVVVISHRVWQQGFAGDPHVVGQAMRLAGVPHTIVGVMPVNFGLPAPTDVWLPLGNPTFVSPTARIFNVFARLRPGAPMGEVNGLMADFTRQTQTEDSVVNRDFRYRARPLRDALVDTSGPAIWLVQAGAGLLFVLAVSNVWSLFLAMVIERRHETAVRRALGASTRDIVWLLVRRSLALAIPAGVLGAVLAWSVLPLVRQLHPTPVLGFLLSSARIDAGVLLAAIALTLAGALAIAVVPAWYACRADAASALGASSRGTTLSRPAARWQRALVFVQSALTVVVLFAAVVSGVSFWKLSQIADGFETTDRTIVHVMLPDARYATHPSRVQFANRLTEEVGRSPDVAAFAFTTTLPVGDVLWGGRFFPELPDGSFPQEPVTLHYRRISPAYLETMGIPLLRGRRFEAHDDAAAPLVAIVSRAAADRLWAGRDPIGKRLRRFVQAGTDAPPLEVVGLAGDTMDAGYASPVGEAIYVPFAQQSVARLSMVVRPRGTADAAVGAVRRALLTVDPTVAANDIAPLQTLVDDARMIPRLQMMLLTVFGIIAVGLTAVGSYGVMSQLVASRQRELAVRLAVGATPRRVGGMVLGQNARLALGGIALGLVASWQIGKLIAPLVFGISSTSPVALATVGATTLFVTCGATLVPAVRAALVDVTRGLRN
jgi:putative ABC transport system permease protein